MISSHLVLIHIISNFPFSQLKMNFPSSLCLLLASYILLCNAFDSNQELSYAIRQYSLLAHSLEGDDRFISTGNPNNLEWDKSTDSSSWTVGFYAGSLWKLYKLTNDNYWKDQALHKQETVRHRQYDQSNHDVGFIIMSSFGNGLELIGDRSFEDVIIQAATSLATRFHCKYASQNKFLIVLSFVSFQLSCGWSISFVEQWRMEWWYCW